MSGQQVLAAICGAGFGLGLLLVFLGIRGVEEDTPALRERLSGWRDQLGQPDGKRLVATVVAGLGVLAVTGWLVGAVLAALAAWYLPRMLGRDTAHAARLARIEAIATWTEMLRDTLAAAAGLEQTILATAATAPEPIRAEVTELATRLEREQRLGHALRGFAARLADPTADLVVAALLLAAEHHARNLGDLLSSLAEAARAQASMRMRVAAGRARTRTSVRVIVTVTLAMAAGLVLFNRGYLAPYDGPAGQLVLLAVGGLFAFAFSWLSRIAKPSTPERFLTNLTAPSAASAPAAGNGHHRLWNTPISGTDVRR